MNSTRLSETHRSVVVATREDTATVSTISYGKSFLFEHYDVVLSLPYLHNEHGSFIVYGSPADYGC